MGLDFIAKHLLAPDTYFGWYRKRENEFEPFFSQEDSLVYCHNILELLQKLGAQYDPEEWRFLIDSSKQSLKGARLHNTNQYGSVRVVYSINLKENYENLETAL